MQDSSPEPSAVQQTEVTSSISWDASEYLHHDKDAGWAMVLVSVAVLLSVASYLVLKDVFSVIVIVLMMTAVGVYGFRKPRTLNYHVSEQGLAIGERQYTYDNFRSFSVVDEGSVKSILFEPLKRFMPAISIYFEAKDEEKIKEVLSAYLPYKQRNLDLVDRVFQKLRF